MRIRSANRALVEQVDSMAQGVAQRVIDPFVESLDLNAIIARVDLNQALDRVDINKLLARVDINRILGRVDVEALVKNTDLGALFASSSKTLVTEAVDLGRDHAVSMDDTLARWVSRLRRHHSEPAPPESANAYEEP